MRFEEYRRCDAVALAGLVHKGEVSAGELLDVVHWTAEGLPVGVHFAGRYAEEATLLRLVVQLESGQPWFNQVPEL